MKIKILTAIMSASLFACGVDSTSIVRNDQASDTERGETATEESLLRADESFDVQFEAAGKEFNVPAGLIKAVSFAMTRYDAATSQAEFDGDVQTFGIMGLTEKALTEGALLAKISVDEAKTDVGSNIRAAAAYLSAKASTQNIERDNLDAWKPIVGEYANIEDLELRENFVAGEVFTTLKLGVGRFSTEMEQSTQAIALEKTVGEFAEVQQKLARAPDYAGALWRPSRHSSARVRTPKIVVIHTCEGNYSGCVSTLVSSSRGVSAHYVVSTGTEITQLVREKDRAFHIGADYNCSLNAGSNCALNGVGANDFSIGIEHAGKSAQRAWGTAQIDASAKLVCDISKSWGIPRDRQHIVGHGQLQPHNRTDPGSNWPWALYMQKINRFCSASPSTPPTTTPPPVTPAFEPILIDSNNANNNSAKGYLTVSANWKSSTTVAEFYRTGYFYANTQNVADGAAFWFKLESAQSRTIDAWWTDGSNRAGDATFVAFNAQGVRIGDGVVNQKINGGKWNQVGTFGFTAGWNKVVLSRFSNQTGVVIADGLRIR